MLGANSSLIISVTKPKGKPAVLLAKNGFDIQPIAEDEGNVDRYILSPRLAVDRRTGSTFLHGIQDKSLFSNAIYLREHFETAVLILEGEINYEFSAFSPQAVWGAQAAMVTVYGISMLMTSSLDETVALITMLARQEQVGVPEISLVPKRKAADLPDQQRRIVEMLPGSGMVLARQLLQHFGSIQRLANSSIEELCRVHGIGRNKAAELHKVLVAEYAAVDTEKQFEDILELKPELLFNREVKFVVRQHVIFTDNEDRQIIDLVFFDPEKNILILVELKRGPLTRAHERQLNNYLKVIHRSSLLKPYQEGGAQVWGILATVEPCDYKSISEDISVQIVNKESVIQELKNLRQINLGLNP